MKNLKRQDKNGVRQASDIERKYKLGQIDYTAEEIEKLKMQIIVDSALSTSSLNPVQNKVLTLALNDKVTKEAGKGLSTNDYTNEEKAKLETLEGSTINVGTTITGEAGTEARVTNSGTEKNAIFDFIIPRGETGESGVTTQISGFFTMAVDSDGNLYVYHSDEDHPPEFEYDSTTGNLYFITEVQ